MQNLVIDIGNTRCKLGLFEQKKLIRHWHLKDWALADLQKLLRNEKINAAIIAASGNIPEGVEEWLSLNFQLIQLTHRTPLPIQNEYATPETLGRDRLAGVVGAWSNYKDKNILKIDAGTCITYDLLTAEGIYKGGSIAPGMMMRLKAMHHFTARLPLIEASENPLLTGHSTETAMQSGAQWGIIHEIDGFINTYQAKYNDLQVVLSGGDANFLIKYLKKEAVIIQDLVLIGLNSILEYNLSK